MNEVDMSNQTIDESKEESIKKAVELLEKSLNNSDRELVRPNVKPLKGILKITVAAVCFVLLAAFWGGLYPFSIAGAIILFAIVVLNLKRAIIWVVLCYQKYAPERIRRACLFTPSCSEYMILAVQKYGVIKGVFKGINRLLRCHNPNGGVDYP